MGRRKRKAEDEEGRKGGLWGGKKNKQGPPGREHILYY